MLPIVVIGLNVFALLYAGKSRTFVKMHQARAKEARAKYAPKLNELNDSVDKPDSNNDLWNRTRFQQYIHGILIIISLGSVDI